MVIIFILVYKDILTRMSQDTLKGKLNVIFRREDVTQLQDNEFYCSQKSKLLIFYSHVGILFYF